MYQLTIHGEMSDVIRAEFADFELRVSHGETHLGADLPDPAALYGLIGRIEALGLVLLDLHRCETSSSVDEDASALTDTPPLKSAALAPPNPPRISRRDHEDSAPEPASPA